MGLAHLNGLSPLQILSQKLKVGLSYDKIQYMTIKWYGHSCFHIISNSSKNSPVSIIIDPFNESIGLKLPRKLEADIVLITHDHDDHNNIKKISDSPFLITSPGEYDVKEVSIKGISVYHDNSEGKERGRVTAYKIETEKMNICHLSDLGQKELTSDQVNAIGEVDILMIPIGGHFTVDAKEAAKIMAQIEPKIIIPMHYKLPNLKIKLDSLDDFLKTLGIKNLEKLSKLIVKEKDLPREEVKIIALEP